MESPPPSELISTDEFLRTVLRSGLLNRHELQGALRDVPKEQRHDSHALAEHLVRASRLSPYQARKLLLGVARGLVLGPYQVLAPLGKGGMGTVFLGRDTRSENLVALKVLPPGRAQAEERVLARFLREMVIQRRLNHPNLAGTVEAGRIQKVYYIAMEYIPGRTLSRMVHADGPLEVPRLARLMAEVTEALHHAHDLGVIHRDLKPSNIMITPHDHAKVLDLGLAMLEGEEVTDITVVGGRGYIVGTMDYIAPEQTNDASAVDRRCDIYSLGCTLYFALAGQPPFPGGTSKDKIRRHRTNEPTPLAQLAPWVPEGFAALVHRMMSKDPELRYPTAFLAGEALRGWAAREDQQPLDRPDDEEYRAAVAAARATEHLPTGSTTELPVLDLPEELWEDGPRVPMWTFWLAAGLTVALAFLAGLMLALGLKLGWF